jgi:hypothetical protein
VSTPDDQRRPFRAAASRELTTGQRKVVGDAVVCAPRPGKMTALRRFGLASTAAVAGVLLSGASAPAVEQPEVAIQTVRLVAHQRVLVTASLACTPGSSFTAVAVVSQRGEQLFSAQGSTGGACDGDEANLSIPVSLAQRPSSPVNARVTVTASTCDAHTCLTDEDSRNVTL